MEKDLETLQAELADEHYLETGHYIIKRGRKREKDITYGYNCKDCDFAT